MHKPTVHAIYDDIILHSQTEVNAYAHTNTHKFHLLH